MIMRDKKINACAVASNAKYYKHKPEVNNSRLIDLLSAEQLAEKFHTLYEGFAPEYGYKTRDESAVQWADVPEQNKKLMIRVCRTILGRT